MPKKCKTKGICKQNNDYKQKYSSGKGLPKEVKQRQRQVQRQMKKR